MNFLEIVFILFLEKLQKIVKAMEKIIRGILQNLTDYSLNIIVNVNFFGDLEFEYY